MLYHRKIRTTFTCVSWLLSKGKQAKYTAFTGKLNNIFHFLKACIERNSNIYYRNQTCPPPLVNWSCAHDVTVAFYLFCFTLRFVLDLYGKGSTTRSQIQTVIDGASTLLMSVLAHVKARCKTVLQGTGNIRVAVAYT